MKNPIDGARKIDAPEAPSHSSSGTFLRTRLMPVLELPHAVLTQRARMVDPCDPEIVALSHVLTATMRASPACVGLAATQVGEPVHLFCMDVTGHKKTRSCAGLVVLVNAHVVAWSEDVVMREGCMSVPDFTGDVWRAAEVIVEGLEPGTGRTVRVSANGMEARCLQHELDHLEGFVFTERVKDRVRDLFPRKTYA